MLFASAALLLTAAQARVGEVNNWSLFQHDGSCAAITTYGRDMMVRVGHDPANDVAVLTLARPIWRAVEEGREYPIRIELSNGRYYASPPNYGIVFGEGDSRRSGISIRLNGDEFLADFAGAAWMEVKLDGILIASLNLRGTRDVMRQVAACSARAFRQDTRDPFASVPPAPPTPAPRTSSAAPRWGSPPTPARLRSGSISTADIPASARRAGISGTTRITVSVSAQGSVDGCTVSGSSGSAELDQIACNLARSRFRFTPATRDGVNVPGTYSQSVRWVMPED